ncbi:Acetyl esterase/lipase [Prosthecobacter debontii]|uniref:Acetyl esterase/lipase n=1 Tax=Prosthecobacter debontii TaxID=48467 RepID=A0A1T4YHE7_9BACT|nr:alpha/beta hydrolase [Prosthecobacter debontii]SKB01206.1 Acetyl esterase/lipase [Prosthecobacter debontii]
MMKKSWYFLLGTLLVSLNSCTSREGSLTGQPVKPIRVGGFDYQRDIVYTPPSWPQAIPADLYVPQGPGPWPGVLLIHGGSWANTDRRSDMEGIAEHLARRGYVVLNATYRLAPEAIYPAQLHDLQQALRYLRAHAAELHLRADRLAAFGYSAGGQLAAQLGAVNGPASLRIQAVVAGGAPTDLRRFPRSPIVAAYLGGSLAEKPSLHAEASPVTHLDPSDPPVFLYHGTRDTLVPPDQTTRYAAALAQAGIPHELVWQKGRGHVGAFLAYGEILDEAIGFLDRHLRR